MAQRELETTMKFSTSYSEEQADRRGKFSNTGATITTYDYNSSEVLSNFEYVNDKAVVVKTCKVTQNLTNVTSSNTDTEVNKGGTFETVISVEQGPTFAHKGYGVTNISVTIGGEEVAYEDFISNVVKDTDTGIIGYIITLENVSGNVVITASASYLSYIAYDMSTQMYNPSQEGWYTVDDDTSLFVLSTDTTFSKSYYYPLPTWDRYSITQNLTNVSSSNTDTEIIHGNSFTTTLTADSGYTLDTPTVTMGGETAEYTFESGVLTVENVTGDLVITATATEDE